LKIRKQKTPISKGRHNRIAYLAFLVIVPLVLYFRVVNFGLSGLDDESFIRNITNTDGSKINLKAAFTHDAFMSDEASKFYRPMQVLSIMIDTQLGDSEPWMYHLSNLLLHLFTVIALFFLLKKTGIREEISFLLALFFSIHPLFTNAVAWIPARGDILLCLFSLLSFITFLEYFYSRKIIYFILHAFVFLLVIFSKETAVLLPVIILTYLYFVQKNKFKLKEIIPFLALWFFISILFFLIRQSVLKVSASPSEFGITTFIKDLPTLPITFSKFIIPYNLSSMPFFNNAAIISGIILFIVLTGIIYKIIRGDKRVVIWGALWFLLFSIPPMLFRAYSANIGYDYFEYRTYLPMIGVLIITGILIKELTDTIPFKKILVISIPLLLLYALIAFNYSEDFEDSFTFFTAVLKTSPNNVLALAHRGYINYNRGNNREALSDYDSAIRICPTYSVPYYNKGIVYQTLNDHYRAEYSFSLALKYDTLDRNNNFLHEGSYANLSAEKLNFRKFDEAILLLKKAIRKYPGNRNLHINLALVYYYCSKFDSSIIHYNTGIELKKDVPEYYNGRGMVKYNLKDYSGALADFSKALELKQDFVDALKNRGMLKISLNDNEGAISDLTSAININPYIGEIWYNRGLAYYKINKQAEAARDRAEAEKLGFQDQVNRTKD
jgi:protein O-mannosyl-transferase